MKTQVIIIIAFLAMVGAQWFVPLQVIATSEGVLSTGKAYKFRTAPVDPTDVFRGKYVRLGYANSARTVYDISELSLTQNTYYVTFGEDFDGFAYPSGISKLEPKDEPFLKVEIFADDVSRAFEKKELVLNYPFDRFYMEESKAPRAEAVYRKAARDESSISYALVKIEKGRAVLEDVLIDDVSLKVLSED